MEAIRKILVGLELHQRGREVTPGSATACRQATWLAKVLGASVDLIHSTWSEDYREPATGAVNVVHQRVPAEGRAALEAMRREVVGAGVACSLNIVEERPWLAITHAVLARRADLVLVGKRNEERGEGRRVGSVTVKLLRKCPCPVWTVKPDHDLELKLVLVATDLTPVGDRALRTAALLAARHQGELHVVHAFQIPVELQAAASGLSEQEYAERLEAERAQARGAIERVLARCDYEGDPVIHLAPQIPSAAIKEAVEHLQPDLLVMGTVSRGGLAGFLVGNTAEKILERVDCSLLTVKPDDFVCPVQPA